MTATITTARVPPLITRSVLPRSGTDFMTEAGAGQLAAIIKKAWADVGYNDVEAWAVRIPRPGPDGSKKGGIPLTRSAPT
jgi:hypothetical protein